MERKQGLLEFRFNKKHKLQNHSTYLKPPSNLLKFRLASKREFIFSLLAYSCNDLIRGQKSTHPQIMIEEFLFHWVDSWTWNNWKCLSLDETTWNFTSFCATFQWLARWKCSLTRNFSIMILGLFFHCILHGKFTFPFIALLAIKFSVTQYCNFPFSWVKKNVNLSMKP